MLVVMRTILSTDRCVLASLTEEDFTAVAQLYVDPEVRKYLGGAITSEQIEARFTAIRMNPEYFALSIHIRDTNAFAGLITLAPHQDGEDTEISIQLMPKYWGQGLATETLRKVLDYAFNTLGINWLIAETQSVNDQSRALVERVGMEQIGELTRFGTKQVVYAMTYKKSKVLAQVSEMA